MAFLKNVLIAIDQLLNCLVWVKGDGFGYPDETMSARAWRLREQSSIWRLIDIVFWFDPQHCHTSYLSEQTRQQEPNEYRK